MRDGFVIGANHLGANHLGRVTTGGLVDPVGETFSVDGREVPRRGCAGGGFKRPRFCGPGDCRRVEFTVGDRHEQRGNASTVDASLTRLITSLGVTRVHVAGGTGSVSESIAAALAGHDMAPLFVVPATCIPYNVIDSLRTMHPARIVLLGGTGSLSPSVDQLMECSGRP